jgi:ankyrin repeat protein
MLISSLLDAGAPLNGDGTTQIPIIAAAARGDIELIDLLLKRGANIDASYSPGRTALFEALFSQKLGTAKFLIEHGANVNVADEAGTTYAMIAASWRNPEFLNCLLESGASVTAENRFGQGLLSNAARAGNLQRVQDLMSRGARIEATGKSGTEALRWAIEGQNPAIVSLFIKQGVDVNAHIPYESITLLQKAEQLGNQQIIALLRSAGARGN